MDNEKGSAGWLVLGLFFPVIGFILWLVWKDSKPGDSRMAGKGTLIGIVISVVIVICVFALGSCMVKETADTFKEVTDDMLDKMLIK